MPSSQPPARAHHTQAVHRGLTAQAVRQAAALCLRCFRPSTITHSCACQRLSALCFWAKLMWHCKAMMFGDDGDDIMICELGCMRLYHLLHAPETHSHLAELPYELHDLTTPENIRAIRNNISALTKVPHSCSIQLDESSQRQFMQQQFNQRHMCWRQYEQGGAPP